MKSLDWRTLLPLLVAVSVVQAEAATYQQQIKATSAAIAAKGTNSIVVQVEAPARSADGKWSAKNFAPDPNDAQFKGIDIRVDAAAKTSQHSNTVAQLLFGTRRSIARGIDTAYIFHSGSWLGRLSRWDLDPAHVSQLFPGPVVNHSHVAKPRTSGKLLRRTDYSALSNNVLHVAGVRRVGPGEPMMAGGYNSLVVGGAVKNIETPYPVIDEFYGEGRTRPHLVGPYPHASAAAPIAAAAAVRLNALAAENELVFPTTSRRGSEQLPVELVKAILMASASADFEYTYKKEVLVNGFGTLGITANGLDKRYGMGMLNVSAAEQILNSELRSGEESLACSSAGTGNASGKAPFAQQRSVTLSSSCPAAATGYSYHSGTTGSDGRSAVFPIKPSRDGKLTASLVWLADVRRDANELAGSVYDFDLKLVDNAGSSTAPLATSAANFDTTENVRASVKRDRNYALVVTRKDGGDTPWPFALAWILSN